jgi:hypothetical protein
MPTQPRLLRQPELRQRGKNFPRCLTVTRFGIFLQTNVRARRGIDFLAAGKVLHSFKNLF